MRSALPFFVIAGVLLSTLHQSSLGSLYLIVPNKLHPLWYSPLLPVLFFLSALSVGCSMVILESFLSQQAFGHPLKNSVREELASMSLILLIPYALLRVIDLLQRGAMSLAFGATFEGRIFLLEMFLGVLLPIALLSFRQVRSQPRGQLAASILTILGFVLHRLNVSITGMDATLKSGYFPAWTEVAITVMIVAVGFAVFGLAARHLPVFGTAPANAVDTALAAVAKEKGLEWDSRPEGLPTGYRST